jgi:hypothetical protein
MRALKRHIWQLMRTPPAILNNPHHINLLT